MNMRLIVDGAFVPALAAHMRLRFDNARQSWTIQAPERSFLLDQNAHAIVSRCDGTASLDAIIDSICAVFTEAPRDMVAKDVTALVQNFVDKSVMVQR